MLFDYRHIWKMSYPILVSMLMQQLVGITDVIYLGRLGEIELGASALGSTYFFTIFMVAFGFSIGAQIMMARRNGSGKYKRIGEIFYQGCNFLLIFWALMVVISWYVSPLLLSALIENEAVCQSTLEYINWRIWGLAGASVLVMGRGFFVAITKTYILTAVSIIMVVANIVLNYVMIFGKFGFPAMGIAGAALASNLSEIIAVSFLSIYLFKRVDIVKYGLNKLTFINLKLLKRILNISVWTMLQQFISVSTWFLFFIAIEHLGERELAVSNIVRSLSSFPYVIISALAAAVSSITGNLIGKGCSAEVLPAISRATQLCGIIIFPLLILMALAAYPLLRIYTDNQALIQASIPAYLVMLSAFIPLTPAWILFNAVSGTGNTRYAMKIEFYSMFVYVFHIFVVILYFKLPLVICWTADWVYNVSILIMAYRYMHSNKWQHKKI